jgi:hypothetical protein
MRATSTGEYGLWLGECFLAIYARGLLYAPGGVGGLLPWLSRGIECRKPLLDLFGKLSILIGYLVHWRNLEERLAVCLGFTNHGRAADNGLKHGRRREA